ncbi:unnamed protein product [Amaranthus hypochondriacus]
MLSAVILICWNYLLAMIYLLLCSALVGCCLARYFELLSGTLCCLLLVPHADSDLLELLPGYDMLAADFALVGCCLADGKLY